MSWFQFAFFVFELSLSYDDEGQRIGFRNGWRIANDIRKEIAKQKE